MIPFFFFCKTHAVIFEFLSGFFVIIRNTVVFVAIYGLSEQQRKDNTRPLLFSLTNLSEMDGSRHLLLHV